MSVEEIIRDLERGITAEEYDESFKHLLETN